MSESSSKGKVGAPENGTILVVGGKKFTIPELKKQMRSELIADKPSVSMVMKALYDSPAPMSRAELAEKIGKSTVHVSQSLKLLRDAGYAARIELTRRLMMYALTEKGYEITKARFSPHTNENFPAVTIEQGDSLSEVVFKFLDSNWGNAPRTLTDVRESLQSYGLNYPKQSVAVALLRLAKAGRIRRFRNESGYVYVTSRISSVTVASSQSPGAAIP